MEPFDEDTPEPDDKAEQFIGEHREDERMETESQNAGESSSPTAVRYCTAWRQCSWCWWSRQCVPTVSEPPDRKPSCPAGNAPERTESDFANQDACTRSRRPALDRRGMR
jgi:hypothetical protein